MHLWNDYEGKTLAGRYTLAALLRPEGRSALFTLAGNSETPSLIRITESINDAGEMLATWRRLAELKQDNLLEIKDFGETSFEGTPLTYAVLQPTDATLADLLDQRAMTQPEALQLATGVTQALSALHAANLVHEHVDATNVFAVGETVKLRADCVRECLVDNEFVTTEDRARLIAKDTADFGLMLLRALTLEKKLRPGLRLPGPFDRVIAKAIDGTWTLDDITRALTPAAPKIPVTPKLPAAAATATLPAAASAPITTVSRPQPAPAASPSSAATTPAAVAAAIATAAPATQTSLPYAETPAPASIPAAKLADVPVPHPVATENPLLFQRRIQVPTLDSSTRLPRWAPLAAAAIALVALVLFLIHGTSSPKPQTSVLSAPPARTATQTAARPAAATPASNPAPPRETAADTRPAPTARSVQPGWYVIAYTFNHEEQALKRAEAILQRYPGLHPQVIAPGGNGYLVALGGAMSRNEAENIRSHARRAGLPRDTFVRNYGS